MSKAFKNIRKLNGIVNVLDVGAIGDGVANDSPAFTAAFAKLGAAGGTVFYPQGRRYLLDTDVTVPSNCTLRGPMGRVGSPQNNASAAYGAVTALLLNPAAKITISGGAGVEGALIHRKGMTFPAAGTSAFTGTALKINGDDAFVSNSLVMGFNQALDSDGFQRVRIDGLQFDCINGIRIANCLDISYLGNCHGWPFATVAGGGALTNTHRSGTAFLFTNVGDWNKITNSFCYGYFRGYNINNCESVTLLGCGADNSAQYTGSIGFLVDSTAKDARLVACQAAGQTFGYYIGTSATFANQTRMTDSDSWGCTSAGIFVNSGDLRVNGGTLRNTPIGIDVQNGNSSVWIDGVRFASLSTAPINVGVINTGVHIGGSNDFSDWPAGSAVTNNAFRLQRSIPSASALLVPANGKYFQVTGSTTIGGINGGWSEREVTLKFMAPVTVANSSSLKLAGGVNFAATADDVLTLVHDGSAWFEQSRSLN